MSSGSSQQPDETGSSVAETYLLPTAPPDKQDRDIALAAELLKSGMLTDRELSSAIGAWSLHGSVSLAEHLRQQNALNDDQIADLEQRASSAASAVLQASSEEDLGASVSLVETLEKFDETGRVARLMGVSVASGAAESADRRSDARYRLIRKLGQGGLGRVWLARDQSMQRLVALKEITNAKEATEAIIARFRNEAEITGRLEHPGIVPVYQLGEDVESGSAFYTMRFLGKATLQDSVAEYHERREDGDHDPMLLRQLLTAFVNICHAIGHAHSRKVIHRDLKPENVVIDSFGQVIVIDWGLAKVLDDAEVEQLGSGSLSGDGSGTVEGQVLGTPLYMAPEQAAGRLDEVDERTDIYGLGAILFSIITGYAPHESTQAKAVQKGGGARALVSAIVGGPTPKAAELHPHVDPVLSAICAKAMSRKRYARYQSASHLADEVQHWMAGEPVSAYEEPPLMQARRWVKRHERLSQLLGALLAILVASAVTLAVSARQNQIAQRHSRFEQMRGDAREIELQLRSAAKELASDARFASTLPPIQHIIRARAGATEESEDVWRGRLEAIFTGMLRAEPKYLAVAYVAGEDGAARELVRVERNAFDRTLLRSLPTSRLRRFDEDPFLDKVLAMEPGDSLMSIDPRPWQTEVASQIRRLTIGVPVFSDDTGQPFGMVAIETDVATDVESILGDLGSLAGDVYITDPTGVIWVGKKANGEKMTRVLGESITKIVPGAAPAFEPATGETAVNDGQSFLAKRVQIDPTGIGTGIVVAEPGGR